MIKLILVASNKTKINSKEQKLWKILWGLSQSDMLPTNHGFRRLPAKISCQKQVLAVEDKR